MEDAELDAAAELAVQGATKNSGQRCTAVKRVLVVEEIADKFAELVLLKAWQTEERRPDGSDTDIGTVIHERAARQFEDRVNDAVTKGAKLLLGNDRKGALYPATVVDHVPPACALVREETFGPVLPIIRCPNDVAAVIRIANATPTACRRAYAPTDSTTSRASSMSWRSAPSTSGRCLGYRIELSPFGGIKDRASATRKAFGRP